MNARLNRFGASTLVLVALVLPAAAQSRLLGLPAMRSSASGQFVVVAERRVSALAGLPAIATNAEFARIEPALLAVSAERVKESVWRALGIDALAPWSGKIFLALHPAVSLDENVAIISTRFVGGWNYRVELPDVVSRARLTRALTGVVLLELANRDDPGRRSAEIPAWLTEGLTQQFLAEDPTLILSAPDKLVPVLVPSGSDQLVGRVPEDRINIVQRGVDPLGNARRVLAAHPTLTFDQLSWPDGAELSGGDGGVYRASAQLFVNDLLALKHGAANLRAMLQLLPRFYNWQTAFRAAFAADFPQPVDVEKWWGLQTVSFAASGAGPLWTPAASRAKLDDILSVPVDFRSASNSLPARAAVSLQAVIRNFSLAVQTEILKNELRELELAHWRMAPPYAVLTEAYRRALAGYLGGPGRGEPWRRNAASTLNQLDALDAQRRAIENPVPLNATTHPRPRRSNETPRRRSS